MLSLGVAVSAVTITAPPDEGFMRFKQEYHKSYASAAEEAARLQIFSANLEFIAAENRKGHSHRLGVGPFADLTEEEFLALYTAEPSTPAVLGGPHYLGEHVGEDEDVQAAVDWTTKGAVTPVKDQGHCGSCWSFSSTGVLEGAYAVRTGTLVSLSEQELVDCMMVNQTSGIGKGCHGGWPYDAMNFATAHDMDLETEYPYTGTDGKCALAARIGTAGLKQGTVTGYKSVPTHEKGLVSAASSMPISITVKADKNMQHYQSGVLSIPCNGSDINHAVLVVGHGLDAPRYVKVKNSWSTSWGEGGYMKMDRRDHVNPSCVYNDAPVYPVLA